MSTETNLFFPGLYWNVIICHHCDDDVQSVNKKVKERQANIWVA